MLYFTDEYEYEASDGNVYVINVEGTYHTDEYETLVELSNVDFLDSENNSLDKSDPMYMELLEETKYHDFEFEEHSTNNDYYGDHEEPLLDFYNQG